MATDVVPFDQRIGALSVSDVREQVNLIQHIMREIMKAGEHYGVIPGTGTKPTLFKGGAEKLCLTFRLDPEYEITEVRDDLHLTITSKCVLWHIPSGQRFGSGMGSCSTRESKYAYRIANRKCPNCGVEAITKGKDFKGTGEPTGWICFAKKGGCGAKFKDGDEDIEKQKIGRIPNENLADQYNTVLKVANKRSLVAVVLNVTAASDIFTQDIEDNVQDDAALREVEQRAAGADVASSLSSDALPSMAGAPTNFEPLITERQLVDLIALLGEVPNGEARLKHHAKIERLSMLPVSQYARAILWAEKARKEPR